MTKEEFRKEVESFWWWINNRDRPASSFFYSLEQWAAMKGNEAYKAENKK